MGWVGDQNNTSHIPWPLFSYAGERLDDQDIAAMIQAADEDGNGEISFPGKLSFVLGIFWHHEWASFLLSGRIQEGDVRVRHCLIDDW